MEIAQKLCEAIFLILKITCTTLSIIFITYKFYMLWKNNMNNKSITNKKKFKSKKRLTLFRIFDYQSEKEFDETQ